MLTLAFNIQPVEAGGTIYIRADGSIDPLTANITTADNVTYTFTDNNYDSIVIQRSDIIVDGNGYAVQGTGTGEGLHVDLMHNVTIKNMEIKSFAIGIWFGASSYNNTIIGNNITNIQAYGISPGIILYHSSNNTIVGNNITNSDYGIYICVSANNTLRSNYMSGNLYNFGVYGATELAYYVQDIDSSNTVDGKPVYYWVNHENESVPADAGYVALVNSTNITAQNLELKNNMQLLLLACTNNSLITSNNMTGGGEGRNDGIDVRCSSNNAIVGNNITNSDSGILLDESSNNTISGNNITENVYGVHVRDYSYNNIIVGNNIIDNGYGFYVEYVSVNTIYHNNFIGNFIHALVGGTDTWDDGYPSGGNYWSDYTGVDEKNGAYQNETGSDGIGDTPYIINDNNQQQDNFPLMEPWSAPTMIKSLIRTAVFWHLPKGTENSLTSKLQNAIQSLERRQQNAAINKLNAFINEVKAQRNKKLTNPQADTLITEAQRIIDLIKE
jgi:parallel beta-helix repeat protein